MRIVIFGDIHGRFQLLEKKISYLLEKYDDIEFFLSTGDTAFIEKTDKEYVKKLVTKQRLFSQPLIRKEINSIREAILFSNRTIELKKPLYFVHGNHEDFIYLSNLYRERVFENFRSRKRERVFPFEIRKNFFYLGRCGIVSLFGLRILYISGLEPKKKKLVFNNDLSKIFKDYEKFKYFYALEIKNLIDRAAQVRRIDILISHDCPLIESAAAEFGSVFIRRIIRELKPRLTFHGHLHSKTFSRMFNQSTFTIFLKPIFERKNSYVILKKIGDNRLKVENLSELD